MTLPDPARWFPTLDEIRHAADVLQAVSVIYDYQTPEAAQWSAERLRQEADMIEENRE